MQIYVLGGFEVEDGANDGVDLHCVADIGDDFISWFVDHRRLVACEIISKLNEQISRQTGRYIPAMDMENVPRYRGAQFIGKIYDAVRKQQTLEIEHQSFKARRAEKIIVYPYLLKEYRNRWFLICEKSTNKAPQVNIFALDRMHSVEIDRNIDFAQGRNQ